jgi:tetratricopeptide (TPR) repeat protein
MVDRAAWILEAVEALPATVREGSAGEMAVDGGRSPSGPTAALGSGAWPAGDMAAVKVVPAAQSATDDGADLASRANLADGAMLQHSAPSACDEESAGCKASEDIGEEGGQHLGLTGSAAGCSGGRGPGEGAVGGLMSTEWDLRFTREFKDQLFGLRSQPVLLRSLMKNLQRLAAGEQGKPLMKLLKGTPKALRIFESPVKTFNDGGRFLWQYAVDYSPRVQCFTDTIRLWRVCLQHDDVPKAIEFIVASHKRGRTSSLKRHLQPATLDSCVRDGCRFPRNYRVEEGIVPESLVCDDAAKFEALTEMDMEEDTQIAGMVVYTPPAVAAADSFNVLKFYALSDEVVRSIHRMIEWPTDVNELEFPFIPDEREDYLIQMDSKQRSSSILLVGRSGTGKTSIAVGRMWAQYKQWHTQFSLPVEVDGIRMHYHQVFVTANKVLRDQVRKSFNGMKQGFECSSVEANFSYPTTFNEIPETLFPLFLTQVEWLMMLDGTLDEPFFPRNADGSVKSRREGGFHEEVGMLDEIPEDDDWLSDEDNTQSEFGQEDDEDTDTTAEGAPASQTGAGAHGKMERKLGREIDFPVFREEIWPKLLASNKYDTKQLSASALFQEIHSYIKGSDAALKTSNGILSREEYLHLSQKMAPNFKGLSANESFRDLPGNRRGHRDLIYDLFQEYEFEKKKLQAYDISDAVSHIWKRLQGAPYAGVQLHSIFVDEVQDFTPAELKLFIHVCADKNDLFFSGDTCQTIASGVGFRFEDLKCLFKEEQNASRCLQDQIMPVAVPVVNALSINYRTHSGILSVAAGIVDLLEYFFLSTIDVLPRESGFFHGPKPLMLLETKVDVATILIVGSDKKASQIEFGAHQVILVRNQEAKETLPEQFDGCLAMTILESKGLEFDDVFLWNFFADSKVSKEWRLVLTYLIAAGENEAEIAALRTEYESAGNSKVAGMLRPLDFDPHVHQILREELKHLYTAITRARVRVVIYDQDETKRAPMFYYLGRKELIQPLSIFGQQDISMPLAVQTKPEEWRSRGVNLRDMGMHQLAAMCFKNSGDIYLEMESNGDALAKKAMMLKGQERHDGFFNAGELFFGAGKFEKASRCFYESLHYDIAGTLYMKCSATTKHEYDAEQLARHAFTCYRKAGKFKEAVQILVQQKKIKAALKILKDEQEYETAISVLDNNSNFMPPSDLSLITFVELAAVNHPATKALRNGTADASVKSVYLKLLRRLPYDDEITQLKKFPSLHQQLVSRLVETGRFTEAASVLEEHGDILGGAALLLERPSLERSDLLIALDLYTKYASATSDDSESLKYFDSARARLAQMLADDETQPQSTQASESAGSDRQLDRLHLLQLELHVASRRPTSAQRYKALKRVINSAQEQDCKIAEALAACTIQNDVEILIRRCETESLDRAVAGARRCVFLLTALLRCLGRPVSASLSQDVLQAERFFGAVRQGALLSLKCGRKTLLDAWICDSESFAGNMRDGLIRTGMENFHQALARYLSERRLEVIQTIVKVLCMTGPSRARIGNLFKEFQAAILILWATNAGSLFLREGHAFLSSSSRAASFESLFNKHTMSEACSKVAVLCTDEHHVPAYLLERAFPRDSQWRQEREDAICALISYAQGLWRDRKSGQAKVDKELLSRVLEILQGIGAQNEVKRLLLEAARLSAADLAASHGCCAEEEASKLQLDKEIQLLLLSTSAFEEGDYLQRARLTLQLHMDSANTGSSSLSVGQWAAAETAIGEALFALGVASRASYTAAVRSTVQQSRAAGSAPAAILLLPEYLVQRLVTTASQRRRVIPSQVESAVDVLIAALDCMCSLFSCSSTSVREERGHRLSATLWTATANLLIAADPEHVGRGATTCPWPRRATALLQSAGQRLLEALAAAAADTIADDALAPAATTPTNGAKRGYHGGSLFKLQPIKRGGFPIAASPSSLWRALHEREPAGSLVLVSVVRISAAVGTGKRAAWAPVGAGAEFALSRLQITGSGQELAMLDTATERGLQWVRSQAAMNPAVNDFVPGFVTNDVVAAAASAAAVAEAEAAAAAAATSAEVAAKEARKRMEKEDAVWRRSARIIFNVVMRHTARRKLQSPQAEPYQPAIPGTGAAAASGEHATATESGCSGNGFWWAGDHNWDPFCRISRYCMFVLERRSVFKLRTHPLRSTGEDESEAAEAGSQQQLRKFAVEERYGLWDLNRGDLLVDGADSTRLTAVMLGLEQIKAAYSLEIAPTLLGLDRAHLLLEEAFAAQLRGELQLLPEDAVALDMMRRAVQTDEAVLMAALGRADATLWQPELKDSAAAAAAAAAAADSAVVAAAVARGPGRGGWCEGSSPLWKELYPSLAGALEDVRGRLQGASVLAGRLAEEHRMQQQVRQEVRQWHLARQPLAASAASAAGHQPPHPKHLLGTVETWRAPADGGGCTPLGPPCLALECQGGEDRSEAAVFFAPGVAAARAGPTVTAFHADSEPPAAAVQQGTAHAFQYAGGGGGGGCGADDLGGPIWHWQTPLGGSEQGAGLGGSPFECSHRSPASEQPSKLQQVGAAHRSGRSLWRLPQGLAVGGGGIGGEGGSGGGSGGGGGGGGRVPGSSERGARGRGGGGAGGGGVGRGAMGRGRGGGKPARTGGGLASGRGGEAVAREGESFGEEREPGYGLTGFGPPAAARSTTLATVGGAGPGWQQQEAERRMRRRRYGGPKARGGTGGGGSGAQSGGDKARTRGAAGCDGGGVSVQVGGGGSPSGGGAGGSSGGGVPSSGPGLSQRASSPVAKTVRAAEGPGSGSQRQKRGQKQAAAGTVTQRA